MYALVFDGSFSNEAAGIVTRHRANIDHRTWIGQAGMDAGRALIALFRSGVEGGEPPADEIGERAEHP